MSHLLLDEMYPPALAQKLRADGLDVVAVLDAEVGLAGRPDDEVLACATRQGRCVVTENVADFMRLAAGTPHAGLILVSSRRFPRTAAGLARLGGALDRLLSTGAVPRRGGVVWLDAGQ